MNKKAKKLADRIEKGAEALASFCEGLSDTDWKTVILKENRSVGVLVHHVAVSYPVEVDLAEVLASGKPIEGVTTDVIDTINDDHAKEYAKVAQVDTIKLLWKNSNEAAARVRELSDDELDQANCVSLNANAPLTAQFFIEDHALRHSYQHLESIQNFFSL